MQTVQGVLVQNCVTGCASLVNRPLVDLAIPIPDQVIMHDWWLALVAASCGKLEHISAATVSYRQHGSNVFGATKWDMRHIANVVLGNGLHAIRRNLLDTRAQAEALVQKGILNDTSEAVVQSYVDLYERGWFGRRIRMITGRFFKLGFLRNMAMLIVI